MYLHYLPKKRLSVPIADFFMKTLKIFHFCFCVRGCKCSHAPGWQTCGRRFFFYAVNTQNLVTACQRGPEKGTVVFLVLSPSPQPPNVLFWKKLHYTKQYITFLNAAVLSQLETSPKKKEAKQRCSSYYMIQLKNKNNGVFKCTKGKNKFFKENALGQVVWLGEVETHTHRDAHANTK